MRRILSCDPGHTTGIAVYNEEENLELSMAIPYLTMTKHNFVFDLLVLVKPEIILMEGLPSNYVDKMTKELWYHLQSRFCEAKLTPIIIQPSSWKRFVERVEIPGQHARDAATMAKWYIQKEKDRK